MKKLILPLLILIFLIGCNSNKTDIKQKREHDSSLTPLEVVNKRMDFYNRHDFDEFIKLYAHDVKIYTYPEKLLGTGTDNITSIFKPKFSDKSIQVVVISQMNNGDHVINLESVTEDGVDSKYVSIYEVEDGLITSVRFVRDN
ncbi:nuclear transport factor 2 family protein [Flavobacteriaceae bacterium KMM 6898]|nr:nuclear transport factor 2 family protein [Flavobacteriaceae bacterium KMM 6898]